jgi:hypothetical protein
MNTSKQFKWIIIGVIFISIDDNEVHNLRKICDEIFGEGISLPLQITLNQSKLF